VVLFGSVPEAIGKKKFEDYQTIKESERDSIVTSGLEVRRIRSYVWGKS
jgi:hypothetical protein